ncbi:MAG: class I SAM-dependent methyltransferase [Lachnospiraceae bacterium]|nr:class I SAM-dependent methyltransferase [Lachnospiraceae bacterium]
MRVLSKRLECAIGLVTPGHAVLDVGCDHAYAAAELVSRGTAPCAVASDVNRGPLKKAAETIAEAGLTDRITTVLANGIPDVYADYTGEWPVTVLLCGMGGILIRQILEEASEKGFRFAELVLSPQRDQDAVRAWLAANGYGITEECFLREDGKPYVMIKAMNTGKISTLTEAELHFGPVLLRKKDAGLKEQLERRLAELQKIRGSISKETERNRIRDGELEAEETLLKTALDLLQG